MSPYSYESRDDAMDGDIHWNCVFVRDCGPFKTGDKVGVCNCRKKRVTRGVLHGWEGRQTVSCETGGV